MIHFGRIRQIGTRFAWIEYMKTTPGVKFLMFIKVMLLASANDLRSAVLEMIRNGSPSFSLVLMRMRLNFEKPPDAFLLSSNDSSDGSKPVSINFLV